MISLQDVVKLLDRPDVVEQTEKLRKIWKSEEVFKTHLKPAVARMCMELVDEAMMEAFADSLTSEVSDTEAIKMHMTAILAATFTFGVAIGSDFRHKLMLDGFIKCDCPDSEHN